MYLGLHVFWGRGAPQQFNSCAAGFLFTWKPPEMREERSAFSLLGDHRDGSGDQRGSRSYAGRPASIGFAVINPRRFCRRRIRHIQYSSTMSGPADKTRITGRLRNSSGMPRYASRALNASRQNHPEIPDRREQVDAGHEEEHPGGHAIETVSRSAEGGECAEVSEGGEGKSKHH